MRHSTAVFHFSSLTRASLYYSNDGWLVCYTLVPRLSGNRRLLTDQRVGYTGTVDRLKNADCRLLDTRVIHEVEGFHPLADRRLTNN